MGIFEKRKSLERFIREQTLGPGINGFRFIDLHDQVLIKNDLLKKHLLGYSSEILDRAPASVYSTGILFPEDATNTRELGIALDNNEVSTNDDANLDSNSQDNSSDNIETSDTIELNQMYPRAMGLTCCLEDSFLSEKSLEIKLSIRYYQKLIRDREGLFNSRYGLLCEIDRNYLQEFISNQNLDEFQTKNIEPNSFLTLRRLRSDEYSPLKTRIRNIEKQIAEDLYEDTSKIITMRLKKSHCYLSNLKSTIYYELKNSIVDHSEREDLYKISQKIELAENVSSHLNNLIDANIGGYGLWQSETVERTIKIENIDFSASLKKKSYLYNKEDFSEKISVLSKDGSLESEGLRNIVKYKIGDNDYALLSLNFQLNRDSRKKDKLIFVKAQLINTSTPFDEANQDDNRFYSTSNELVNQKSFFGVSLSVTNPYLTPYNKFSISNESTYDEDATTNFIYRKYEDFGIGHGCSINWQKTTNTIHTEYLPSCEVSDVAPLPRDKTGKLVLEEGSYRDPQYLNNKKAQEFKWLSNFSEASNEEVIKGLRSFVDAYGTWIGEKRKIYGNDEELKLIAEQELNKCETDFQRMKKNIKSFFDGNNNTENINAFRLMNAAMFIQLWHSEKVSGSEIEEIYSQDDFSRFDQDFYKFNAHDDLFTQNEPVAWRAFQLAFILLNLDGIFRLENDKIWDKRNNWVDLVWFPTGGGKTEAYLGLIALAIINRRKKYGVEGGGTAAIMRYTLRLLTMQQFQRATLVIMALEQFRRWKVYDLGDEPINIGFWVGNDSMPNKLTYQHSSKSKDSLRFEYEKLIEGKDNKIPFDSCPWCNSKLMPQTNVVSDSADTYSFNRIHLFCDNYKCSFSEPDFFEGDESKGPIPVNLCDESIYQHPPTLLFGTVDKFAQLAHKVYSNDSQRKSDSRRIFGRGNWEAGKPSNGYIPPDLIIQDELHLLQGPLGSAVALFESAINQLCTRQDGTKPKIISSTATTRNTGLQIAALFDRKVDLFPKPGVECDDSFFAFYERKYENEERNDPVYLSKRKYLGVLPTGRSQMWMQMRLTAILLTHRAIFELKEIGTKSPIDFEAYDKISKAMDYYHTTISYFNSLKEVGKTQSQVQSYILKEVRRVFSKIIRPQKLLDSIYTYGPIVESELTGRLSGEDVKNQLKRLETKWNAKNRFASRENGKIVRATVPPEFVVATNMISVGIDVSRFNTMIMNSMPRSTAEYIQASSRVGRNSFGLVLTVHNPFRARDVSHYEKFIEFHEKMYSYVEPISITPFTKKAVERYLSLYLATILRHQTKFVERESAARINKKEVPILVGDLIKYFESRKERLNEFDIDLRTLIKQENVDQIREFIEKALIDWDNLKNSVVAENKNLVFNYKAAKSNPPQEQLYVDIEEYEDNIHSKRWQVPMSLRVIEPEAAIKIYPK